MVGGSRSRLVQLVLELVTVGKEERCYLLWRIEKGLASRAAVPRSAHRPYSA